MLRMLPSRNEAKATEHVRCAYMYPDDRELHKILIQIETDTEKCQTRDCRRNREGDGNYMSVKSHSGNFAFKLIP